MWDYCLCPSLYAQLKSTSYFHSFAIYIYNEWNDISGSRNENSLFYISSVQLLLHITDVCLVPFVGCHEQPELYCLCILQHLHFVHYCIQFVSLLFMGSWQLRNVGVLGPCINSIINHHIIGICLLVTQ